MALSDVLDSLVCPVCGGVLALEDHAARCGAGHSFDVAREGYVNLLPGRARPSTADTTAMVRARQEFLDSGAFAPVISLVAQAATSALLCGPEGVIVDAGAGTGAYLGEVLETNPGRVGVALDISKYAARVSARAHERIGSVVADVWEHLPVRDGIAALVLSVFSPRNAEEFARVLAPGATLIVVTPADDHLAPLVGDLGLLTVDAQKAERLSAKLGAGFEHVSDQDLTYTRALSHAQAAQAAEMGPTASHVSAGELADRARRLPEPVDVTISITLGTYRVRGGCNHDATRLLHT